MSARRLSTIAGALAGIAVAIGCSRNDSLVLLDLRASGPLGAPVARIRLSAKGWATRVVSGSIGPDGLRIGYYGPGNGGAVSVTAEALDAVNCVLGSGSATVPKLAAGATSDPLTLFVRPTPDTGCVPDAGMMDAGDDGGGDDGGVVDAGTGDAGDAGDGGGTAGDAGDGGGTAGDAGDGGGTAGDAANDGGGGDAGLEAGAEGGVDSAADVMADVGVDSAADAMDEAGVDAAGDAMADAMDDATTDGDIDGADDAGD